MTRLHHLHHPPSRLRPQSLTNPPLLLPLPPHLPLHHLPRLRRSMLQMQLKQPGRRRRSMCRASLPEGESDLRRLRRTCSTFICPSATLQLDAVPPGQGKLSTQRRNQRRRQLRASLHGSKVSNASGSTPLPETLPSTSDVLPAPVPAQLNTPAVQPPPSYSLKNKNKRRGFKEAMGSVVPKRINFRDDTDESTSSPSIPHQLDFNAEPSQSSDGPAIGFTMLVDAEAGGGAEEPSIDIEALPARQKTRVTAALVPPSRMKNLPANIIVTSVDVESDRWQTTHTSDAPQEQGSLLPEEYSSLVHDALVDWSRVDDDWDRLTAVDPSSLKIGDIVAWQVCD